MKQRYELCVLCGVDEEEGGCLAGVADSGGADGLGELLTADAAAGVEV